MTRFDTNNEQMIFPATLIRGGTSRGLFFLADEIPDPGQGQERFLAAVMGKPDPLEVDGLKNHRGQVYTFDRTGQTLAGQDN